MKGLKRKVLLQARIALVQVALEAIPPAGRPRRADRARPPLTVGLPRQGGVHHGLGLRLHLGEVLGALERLGVDLVDVLGAGRAGGEPGGLGGDLEAADLGVVAGRLGELGGDRLAGQLGGGDVVGGERRQLGLLLAGGGRVDPGVRRVAVLGDQVGVVLARRPAGLGQDLRGQQGAG